MDREELPRFIEGKLKVLTALKEAEEAQEDFEREFGDYTEAILATWQEQRQEQSQDERVPNLAKAMEFFHASLKEFKVLMGGVPASEEMEGSKHSQGSLPLSKKKRHAFDNQFRLGEQKEFTLGDAMESLDKHSVLKSEQDLFEKGGFKGPVIVKDAHKNAVQPGHSSPFSGGKGRRRRSLDSKEDRSRSFAPSKFEDKLNSFGGKSSSYGEVILHRRIVPKPVEKEEDSSSSKRGHSADNSRPETGSKAPLFFLQKKTLVSNSKEKDEQTYKAMTSQKHQEEDEAPQQHGAKPKITTSTNNLLEGLFSLGSNNVQFEKDLSEFNVVEPEPFVITQAGKKHVQEKKETSPPLFQEAPTEEYLNFSDRMSSNIFPKYMSSENSTGLIFTDVTPKEPSFGVFPPPTKNEQTGRGNFASNMPQSEEEELHSSQGATIKGTTATQPSFKLASVGQNFSLDFVPKDDSKIVSTKLFQLPPSKSGNSSAQQQQQPKKVQQEPTLFRTTTNIKSLPFGETEEEITFDKKLSPQKPLFMGLGQPSVKSSNNSQPTMGSFTQPPSFGTNPLGFSSFSNQSFGHPESMFKCEKERPVIEKKELFLVEDEGEEPELDNPNSSLEIMLETLKKASNSRKIASCGEPLTVEAVEKVAEVKKDVAKIQEKFTESVSAIERGLDYFAKEVGGIAESKKKITEGPISYVERLERFSELRQRLSTASTKLTLTYSKPFEAASALEERLSEQQRKFDQLVEKHQHQLYQNKEALELAEKMRATNEKRMKLDECRTKVIGILGIMRKLNAMVDEEIKDTKRQMTTRELVVEQMQDKSGCL